ncbi:hypothetical protein BN970_01129 [Mycolicibacterium conceptionense]|uniref:Uncharacterized protein n=1 Tax=Mycolicibacterium conceptionense TaxID=451644 RepID=A0A0U1D124_9MYCO|nr:hypothetical protein BN970_01129 [Mycolicibacterium conceptionense]
MILSFQLSVMTSFLRLGAATVRSDHEIAVVVMCTDEVRV